jgi:hypothetical protein
MSLTVVISATVRHNGCLSFNDWHLALTGGRPVTGSVSGGRSGTLTYICGDAPAGTVVSDSGYRGAYVARIEERQVCEYSITVHVPALCEFEPFLRPHERERPPP